MRSMRSMRSSVLVLMVVAACGPGGREDPGPGGPCDGETERCINNAYQTCEDGEFVTQEVCSAACSVALDGCAACDPAQPTTCNGNSIVTCNPDGSIGGVVSTCDADSTCVDGACTRECTADGVDLIYVVDESYNLLSFDPRKLGTGQDPFASVGALNCPTTMGPVPNWPGGVSPYSMSVDRAGNAWVLYTSGEIFRVSTQNASCTATPYLARQANMMVFGMGFALDAPDADAEHLYIGGGDSLGHLVGRLGAIEPSTYSLAIVGDIAVTAEYGPELTGTGNAELFGLFPGAAHAFVQKLDRTTGAPVGTELTIPGGLGDTVTAYAFAQWGGLFYIFVSTQSGGNTVRTIDPATGNYAIVVPSTPYKVVGAGVSICAPFVIE